MQKMTLFPKGLPPVPDVDRSTDMADLIRMALNGWLPMGAGAGLEALFDRMEAAR